MTETNLLDRVIAISQDKEKKLFSPREIVNNLFSLIGDREKNILRDRHGLDGDKPKTLDAIGKVMNLTRERIRQLENQAMNKLKKNKKYEEIIAPLRHLVVFVLERNGGFATLENIIDELVIMANKNELERPAIKFLLVKFLEDIEMIKNQTFKKSLKLKNVSMGFIEEVLEEIEKIFIKEDQILLLRNILEGFKETEYYKNNLDKFLVWLEKNNNNLEKILFSYLKTSNRFVETPLGQWGMAGWESVLPRRINGRIFLILTDIKKPLHFTDITDKINKAWTEKRDIKSATVHNELIADDRFVLVGRGIYGLKEWRDKDGEIEKIIKNVVKDLESDLSDEEIIKKVMDKKLVNEATVRMILKKIKK